MANVKYLGKKKNYGPLNLSWMEAPVVFPDGRISEDIEVEVAQAICEAEPKIFCRTTEKPVLGEVEAEVVEEETGEAFEAGPAFADTTETLNVAAKEDQASDDEKEILKLVDGEAPPPEVVEVAFEDMTIDRLLEYGAPLEGFSCVKRDGKTKIIEAIKSCLPAQ